MRILSLANCFLIFLLSFIPVALHAQTGVLDPDDPVNIYNPDNPPATPAYGTLAKWVKTTRVGYNTDSYKAYFYKGMAFRLKFPRSYKDSMGTGKTYPVFIFFHGVGNKGTIYDNENQLASGGSRFMGWVDNGVFDGFVICPQTSSSSGAFNSNHYAIINELIENYFIPELNADPFRVIVNGLSGGGGSTWQMLKNYPKLVAAGMPISAVSNYDADPGNIESLKYTPIWLFQGGLDNAPAPFTARGVSSAFQSAGADFTYTEYPDLGHSSWNTAWAEPGFTEVMNTAHKANPWPEHGRTEFCPGEPISQVLGVTAGFDGYQWRKDGVLISGADSNTYTAIEKGVYDCRVQLGDRWSVWSPVPVVISEKGVTLSPSIQFSHPSSIYFPSPASPLTALLEVPAGYTSYRWEKEGDTAGIGSGRFLEADAPGQYKVKVTEQFGCFSEFSPLFEIRDAGAPGAPSAISALSVSPLSKTALQLNWAKGSGAFAETGFEIFRSSREDSGYILVGTTAATNYTAEGLSANTSYYFKVRAINEEAASASSPALAGTTLADTTAPSAPADLRVLGTSRNAVDITWNESSDDVAVAGYRVFVNGMLYQQSETNTVTVYNLSHGKSYVFRVVAIDDAGNTSLPSNQVTAQPLQSGLNYHYYTTEEYWTALPDFSTLTPFMSGMMSNVTIAERTQDDRFAYLWEGFINIPADGTYYFRTSSDEGSKLWLGARGDTSSPYSFTGPATVDNDGIHSSISVNSAPLTLQAGVYPITIGYFDRNGGQSMAAFWRTPSTGTSFVSIPTAAFTDPAPVNGVIPAVPSLFTATAVSDKAIGLSWEDNSDNETAFEIWRSKDPVDGFTMIASVSANSTSLIDSAGLLPLTRYYYKLRATGEYGESAFAPLQTEAQAFWRFNNSYYDASGNAKALLAGNGPVFDSTEVAEPSHSLRLNGVNQYLDFVTSAGDYLREAYSEKTVSFWMKSNLNTGGRNVIDIGGRDHGLAIRLDSNRIYAGIASSNIRYSFSSAYADHEWHHISLVYDSNTLRLYVDGQEAGDLTGLPFTSVPAAGAASSVGRVYGTNAFNTGAGYFDGWLDEMAVFGKALTADEVGRLAAGRYRSQFAETLAPLPVPATPINVLAEAQSPSAINVTWSDTSNRALTYEVYRALSGGEYELAGTVQAESFSFLDSLLTPNISYFYKVKGVNGSGASGFSTEDTATTWNLAPVFEELPSLSLYFEDTLSVSVHAADSEGESLHMFFTGLPSFVSVDSSLNGSGLLYGHPQITDTGTYYLSAIVADEFGGSDTVTFSLTVHMNQSPVISEVADMDLDEMQALSIDLTAADANMQDSLVWTFDGLPSFVQKVADGRVVHLSLAPGYADHGSYPVIVKVEDGRGGEDSLLFHIRVNDVDPVKTVYVNFGDAAYAAALPWNNAAKAPAVNDDFANLKDDTGAATSIGILFTTAWGGANNAGANTGGNTGIFPDAVLRSSYYTNASRSFRLYGLLPGMKYDLEMLASRAAPTVGVVGNYTVNGITLPLDAADNSEHTVAFKGVSPAADGTITVTVVNAPGSMYAYLNGLMIRSVYDDSTVPARPRDLQAENLQDKVGLSWIDAAYNEAGYEVYRGSSIEGPYTLLNPGDENANGTAYEDDSVAGNSTYYYAVKAINGYGSSFFSDTVSIVTPNRVPALPVISNVTMSTQQTVTVNIAATDPGDLLTLTAFNLPAFAVFTDNGDGTGFLEISSGANAGVFSNITITATDSHGAAVSQTFSIDISQAGLNRILVNLNQTYPVSSPWNSTNVAPAAGQSLSDLKDEAGVLSGISLTLMDAWTAQSTIGVSTGNNSGIYPDDVMRTFYYYTGAESRRIKLAGLNPATKYDLTFFASRANYTAPLITRYSAGVQSVELNATNNSSQTVRLEGLTPDANGEIIFTAQKAAGTPNTYLGAIVIESYPAGTDTVGAPANLTAAGTEPGAIRLSWSEVPAADSYEIWRSLSVSGTYSKTGDAPAGTSGYTDSGLSTGTIYYYKVRAVSDTVLSGFSNYAAAGTVAYQIHINLNDGSVNAPAQVGNWNNINTLMTDGFILPDLVNDLGQNTGTGFYLQKEFSGFNVYGTTTGNNTGVYPDRVMESFYYVNYADTARFRITGLSLAHVYNFRFFGSRVNPQVGVTGAYKIGDEVVLLDASDNTASTAAISGVVPDADGSVTVTVYGVNANGFAYLNAFSITGAPRVSPDPASPSVLQRGTMDVPVVPSVEASMTAAGAGISEEVERQADQVFTAYPNPFAGRVSLRFYLDEPAASTLVRVINPGGYPVWQGQLKGLISGINVRTLDLSFLPAGLYWIELSDGKTKYSRVVPVLKQ